MTGRRLLSMVAAAAFVLVAYVQGSRVRQGIARPPDGNLEGLAVRLPWHWYFGADPFSNGVAWRYAGLQPLLAFALFVAATWLLDHRDLPG